MTRAERNVATLVAVSVLADKPGVIALLNSRGMPTDPDATREDVADKTIAAMSDDAFRGAYVNWIRTRRPFKTDGYLNDTGMFTTSQVSGGALDLTNSSYQSPASNSGGFFSGFDANAALGLLTTGAGIWGSIKTAETNADAIRAQANAQIKAAQANTQATLAALELEKARLAAQRTPTKNNTVLYVVLGLAGVGLIGTIAYFVTRKQ